MAWIQKSMSWSPICFNEPGSQGEQLNFSFQLQTQKVKGDEMSCALPKTERNREQHFADGSQTLHPDYSKAYPDNLNIGKIDTIIFLLLFFVLFIKYLFPREKIFLHHASILLRLFEELIGKYLRGQWVPSNPILLFPTSKSGLITGAVQISL